MQVAILEEMIGRAGIYGLAFDKKTEKLIYLSPMLAESHPNAKIGDNYKTAIAEHTLFGDAEKNTKALLFDPCEDGLWFNCFTVNKALEDGTEIVLMYAVPCAMPKEFLLVKREEI